MISRFILFCAFFLGLLLTGGPPVKAQSLFDRLFGSGIADDKPYDNPALTNQAPFINPAEERDVSTRIESATKLHKATTIDLGLPHRSPEIIAEWGAGIVAEALTLTADTADQTFKTIQPGFTTYGFQEYQNYLTKAAIIPTLKQNHLRIMAIVTEPAQVIREGQVEATYHWLVQVPVMVTFYDLNMKQLDPTQKQFVQNRYMTVQVQIGRVRPESATDLGIGIERWVISTPK